MVTSRRGAGGTLDRGTRGSRSTVARARCAPSDRVLGRDGGRGRGEERGPAWHLLQMRQHVHQALVHRGCVAPLRRGKGGQAGLEPGHSHAPACLCFLLPVVSHILLVPAQPARPVRTRSRRALTRKGHLVGAGWGLGGH